MARGRGGYQRPSKPAAVSGPGALSARTDGGPMPEYKGLDYGDNKAVNSQMSAAPMRDGSSGAPGAAGGGAPSSASPSPEGIFGGTDRPGEPLTAGVDFGPGAGRPQQIIKDDPNMLLRALAQQFPHPDLDRLLARVARG